MKKMWADVNKTLIYILQKEGNLDQEQAEEYLQTMKKQKRYQVDVY
jgi:sulfite reductase (NADPH) flavoprotein alpha-component